MKQSGQTNHCSLHKGVKLVHRAGLHGCLSDKITGSGDEDLYNYVIGVSSKNRLIQLTGNGCSSSSSLKVFVQLKVAHLTTKEGQNHLMIGSLMCGSRAVKGSYMHDTLPLSGISCFIVLFS